MLKRKRRDQNFQNKSSKTRCTLTDMLFSHHYSAVQVDVFTVVYKRFDSLVRVLNLQKRPLNNLVWFHIFSPHLLCPVDRKRSEENVVPAAGSDGAGSGQHPFPCVPEPAGHPQRQGFLKDKVSCHAHNTILPSMFCLDHIWICVITLN